MLRATLRMERTLNPAPWRLRRLFKKVHSTVAILRPDFERQVFTHFDNVNIDNLSVILAGDSDGNQERRSAVLRLATATSTRYSFFSRRSSAFILCTYSISRLEA